MRSITSRGAPDGPGVARTPLADLCYPLVRRFVPREGPFARELERTLAGAKMSENVELYLSAVVGVGLLVGGVAWLAGTVLAAVAVQTGAVQVGTLVGMPVPNPAVAAAVNALKIPLLIGATGATVGVVGFAAGAGALLAVPYVRAAGREREIDLLLADATTFLYAMSDGGMNQLEAMEALANAEDTYGAVAVEFRTILKETRYFDTDYRTAIEWRADRCPSDELSAFLTDMLSIIESGGDMTRFLDDMKDTHMSTVRRRQEESLDTLELFGEMYLSLSVFPLLLLVILVVMRMLGGEVRALLFATVYLMIPALGVAFLVLVSTVQRDEPSDGVLDVDDDIAGMDAGRGGPLSLGLVDQFAGSFPVFDRIRRRERVHQVKRVLANPHRFLQEHPLYTLVVTVPVAALSVGVAVAAGMAPTTWDGLVANPLWGTIVYGYAPMYVVLVPLGVFHALNVRFRRSVLGELSEHLRKLARTNETGLTVLESLRTVGRTSRGTLAREFQLMATQVQYGMHLTEALVRFNNRYYHPRLARAVKLVSKAQETSSRIGSVLTTAARTNQAQEDLALDRRTRTRVQVVIVSMTFLTMLGVVVVLKLQFLSVLAELVAQVDGSNGGGVGFATDIDSELLSLLFFHAVALQAVVSGVVSGYIKDGDLLGGVRYVLALATVALVVWTVIA